MKKSMIKTLSFAVITITLSGCLGVGEGDEDRLQGKRLSVLHQQDGSPQGSATQVAGRVEIPGAQTNQGWIAKAGNVHHSLGHIALSGSLKKQWSASIGGDALYPLPEPVVAGSTLFALNADGEVVALHAKTGNERWRFALADDEEDVGAVHGGLAIVDGIVYVTSIYGEVVALRAKDGRVLWRRALQSPLRAAPVVARDSVYVITGDNRVYSLSTSDGRINWRQQGLSEVTTVAGAASIAVDRDLLIVPYSSGEVAALQADTGQLLWFYSLAGSGRGNPLSSLASIVGDPVIKGDHIYAVSHNGRFVAISTRTGRSVWSNRLAGVKTPWVAGNTVFLVTVDSALYAIDRISGAVRWTTRLQQFEDEDDREDPIVWNGPVLAGRSLILTSSHGKIAYVDPIKGKIKGVRDLSEGTLVSPVIAQKTLYILDQDGDVTAYK